jgi:hypothetical protein
MLNNNGELFSVAAQLGRGGEEVDMDMSQGDGGKVVAPFYRVRAAGGGPAVSVVFKPSVHWLLRVNEGEEATGRGTISGRGGDPAQGDFLSTHVEEGG